MRILIVRQSAIGDCILTLPMLAALRSTFPDARIDWLVEKTSSSLLEGHPWLNEVFAVNKGWLKRPRELFSLGRRLRQQRYDIVLDPQSLLKSAVPTWLTGAATRIGFAPPQGRELSHWLHTDSVRARADHIVHRQLELLAPLQIYANQQPLKFAFPPFAAAQDRVGQLLDDAGLANHSRWYTLFTGASWASKRWEADRYCAVVKHLAESRGVRAVITWGSDRELRDATSIVESCQLSDESLSPWLAPKLTLPELQTLLRQAAFYLGSDTGPMHLAAASGTACVALFGPTLAKHCGPVGDGHTVVQTEYQHGTTREKKRAENVAMRAIAVDTVIDACVHTLDRLQTTDRSDRQVA